MLAYQKKEAPRHAIMNSSQMVAALVRAISNSNDLETTKGVVGTLHTIVKGSWPFSKVAAFPLWLSS
jgi:hypothetical protein